MQTQTEIEVRRIADFPDYWVTSEGDVISRNPKRRSSRKMKPCGCGHVYLYVTIRKNSKAYKKYVHRLVCEAFHGPCPPGMECAHKDDVSHNNRASNLRWATSLENKRDKSANGLEPRGAQRYNAKINNEQALAIFREGKTGTWESLAQKHGLSSRSVRDILYGRSWSWLTGKL